MVNITLIIIKEEKDKEQRIQKLKKSINLMEQTCSICLNKCCQPPDYINEDEEKETNKDYKKKKLNQMNLRMNQIIIMLYLHYHVKNVVYIFFIVIVLPHGYVLKIHVHYVNLLLMELINVMMLILINLLLNNNKQTQLN